MIVIKEVLGEIKFFGSINVMLDVFVFVDVYVLGKINYLDIEIVEIGVKVMDVKNIVWGEEEFEYCVSEGWYCDVMFCGENFNGLVFE